MGMRRGRTRDERGAAVVEFALIAPLLLLLVFGIIDFGWMLMKANLVNNATRDAARVASLSGHATTDIDAAVDAELDSAGIDADDVTVSITCTNTVGSSCDNTAGVVRRQRHVRVHGHRDRHATPTTGSPRSARRAPCVGNELVRRRHDHPRANLRRWCGSEHELAHQAPAAVGAWRGRRALRGARGRSLRRRGPRRRHRPAGEPQAPADQPARLGRDRRRRQLGAQNGSIADGGRRRPGRSSPAAARASSTWTRSTSGAWSPASSTATSRRSSPAMVAAAQIPTATQAGGVCNPDAVVGEDGKWLSPTTRTGPGPRTANRSTMTCNDTLCAVPCALKARTEQRLEPRQLRSYNNRPIKCNTIRVGAEQDVPFSFAPVMGIDEGSTGSQISVACAGSCGAVAPNPMDVVVVADRTLSMPIPLGCTYRAARCTDYRDGPRQRHQGHAPGDDARAAVRRARRARPERAHPLDGREPSVHLQLRPSKGLVYPSDDDLDARSKRVVGPDLVQERLPRGPRRQRCPGAQHQPAS